MLSPVNYLYMSVKRIRYSNKVKKAAADVNHDLDLTEVVRGTKARLIRYYSTKHNVSANAVKLCLKRKNQFREKAHGSHLFTTEEERKLVLLLKALESRSFIITQKLVIN